MGGELEDGSLIYRRGARRWEFNLWENSFVLVSWCVL